MLTNNFDFISLFEKRVSEYTGAKYAIAVDCASHALFLSLKCFQKSILTIPNNTYFSIPMQCIHANFKIKFEYIKWYGIYKINPLPIYDASLRFTRNMYIKDSIMILSFQHKKILSLNKGGMILLDNLDLYSYIKKLVYDGRDLNKKVNDIDDIDVIGYHYYMTPETACEGIMKLNMLNDKNNDIGSYESYKNISKFTCFKLHIC